MAKHIGVTAFDPGDPSNSITATSGLREGDIEYIVACINGALQELADWVPELTGASRSFTAADLGGASDPGTLFALPSGWEEAVVLPLALQRFTSHPLFQPVAAKSEIARQVGIARKIVRDAKRRPGVVTMNATFR